MQPLFCPALGDSIHSLVSSLSPQVVLLFSVRLSSTQHSRLVQDGARVEVWSDLPPHDGVRKTEEWSALAFGEENEQENEEEIKSTNLDDAYIVDLRVPDSHHHQQEQDSEERLVTLTATTHFPPPPIDDPLHLSFTYRIVYPSTGEIKWLGSFGQNGHLTVRSVSKTEAVPGFTLSSTWCTDANDGPTTTTRGTREVDTTTRRRYPATAAAAEDNTSCVGHLANMHDYRIWQLGTTSISPRIDAAQNDTSTASILIFVPHLRTTTPVGGSFQHASTPSFALACSPGVTTTLSSDGNVYTSATRPGRIVLHFDDLNDEPRSFVSNLLAHSGLVERWTVLGDHVDSGWASRTIALTAGSEDDAHGRHFPVRIATIPLLPSVTPTARLKLGLGFILDKVGRRDHAEGHRSRDLAVFTADEPKRGLHILADSNRPGGSTKPSLLLTVNSEGSLIDFGPVHSFDGTGTKVVILSPYSEEEDTKSHTQPSVSGALPTPPPSPPPPTIIPPLSMILEGAEAAEAADTRPTFLPTPTSMGQEQEELSNASPPLHSSNLAASNVTTPTLTSTTSTVEPPPPTPGAVARISKRSICPPFGSLFTLFRSIFLSVTTFIRLFYGILDTPRRRLVNTTSAGLRNSLFFLTHRPLQTGFFRANGAVTGGAQCQNGENTASREGYHADEGEPRVPGPAGENDYFSNDHVGHHGSPFHEEKASLRPSGMDIGDPSSINVNGGNAEESTDEESEDDDSSDEVVTSDGVLSESKNTRGNTSASGGGGSNNSKANSALLLQIVQRPYWGLSNIIYQSNTAASLWPPAAAKVTAASSAPMGLLAVIEAEDEDLGKGRAGSLVPEIRVVGGGGGERDAKDSNTSPLNLKRAVVDEIRLTRHFPLFSKGDTRTQTHPESRICTLVGWWSLVGNGHEEKDSTALSVSVTDRLIQILLPPII